MLRASTNYFESLKIQLFNNIYTVFPTLKIKKLPSWTAKLRNQKALSLLQPHSLHQPLYWCMGMLYSSKADIQTGGIEMKESTFEGESGCCFVRVSVSARRHKLSTDSEKSLVHFISSQGNSVTVCHKKVRPVFQDLSKKNKKKPYAWKKSQKITCTWILSAVSIFCPLQAVPNNSKLRL